jgi:hypothetical protein
VLASVLMAEAMWLVASAVGGNEGVDALVRVIVSGVAGAAVYAGVLVALDAPEVRAVRDQLSRRAG